MPVLSKMRIIVTLAFLILIFGLVQSGSRAMKYAHNASLRTSINPEKLPQHIAILLDGNGRWAKKQGHPRTFGHRNSLKSLREVIEGCVELGIPYLTVFAFSTENWKRPQEEVSVLFEIITAALQSALKNLIDNDIKLTAIGDIQRLPQTCQEVLHQAMQATQYNKGLQLIIALSYGGRWEITKAVKAIVQDALNNTITSDNISEQLFQQYLQTQAIPDPDLLIRSGGDLRISNFFLWQLAYTELFFMKEYWPEFSKEHLYKALVAYQKRERRFGKVS